MRHPCLWHVLALGLVACGGAPSAGDAGTADDAGPSSDAASDLDAPALGWDELPADRWSFVPIPGGACGNGSAYSVGVNPHAGATQILFFVMGGGACWDTATCFELGAATHVEEDYTRATFDMERAIVSGVGWDDRAAPLNPFRDSHIVFVPYCTGDLHAGDAVATYGGRSVHHRGSVNTDAYLEAARSAWPDLTDVRVIGLSAGGYGAQLNWGRYAEAWPTAELALLADCSPLIRPAPAQYAAWRTSWNMRTPADCAECASTFAAYDDYFDARHPSSRFGLLATTRDSVIAQFWGTPDLGPLLEELAVEHLDDNATTRYFIVDSDAHVILGSAFTLRSADGTLLVDWFAGWLENDPVRWHDTRP